MKTINKKIKQFPLEPVQFNAETVSGVKRFSLARNILKYITLSAVLTSSALSAQSAKKQEGFISTNERSMLNENDFGNRRLGNQLGITGYNNWLSMPKHLTGDVRVSAEDTAIKKSKVANPDENISWYALLVSEKGRDMGLNFDAESLDVFFKRGGRIKVVYSVYDQKNQEAALEKIKKQNPQFLVEQVIDSVDALKKNTLFVFDPETTEPVAYAEAFVKTSPKHVKVDMSYTYSANNISFTGIDSDKTATQYAQMRVVLPLNYFDFISFFKNREMFIGLDALTRITLDEKQNAYQSATDGNNSSAVKGSNTTQDGVNKRSFGLSELGVNLQWNRSIENQGLLAAMLSFHGSAAKGQEAWQRFGGQIGFSPYQNASTLAKILGFGSTTVSLSANYEQMAYAARPAKDSSDAEIKKAIEKYDMLRFYFQINNPGAVNQSFEKWLYRYVNLNFGLGLNKVTRDTALDKLINDYNLSPLGDDSRTNMLLGAEIFLQIQSMLGQRISRGNILYPLIPVRIGYGFLSAPLPLLNQSFTTEHHVKGMWALNVWSINLNGEISYGRSVQQESLNIDRSTKLNEYVKFGFSFGW